MVWPRRKSSKKLPALVFVMQAHPTAIAQRICYSAFCYRNEAVTSRTIHWRYDAVKIRTRKEGCHENAPAARTHAPARPGIGSGSLRAGSPGCGSREVRDGENQETQVSQKR